VRWLLKSAADMSAGLLRQTLLFDLGKYLLLGSSRTGTQPANLVGIWAEGRESPWNGDYHININLQVPQRALLPPKEPGHCRKKSSSRVKRALPRAKEPE